jgi:ankyrin repeat protein
MENRNATSALAESILDNLEEIETLLHDGADPNVLRRYSNDTIPFYILNKVLWNQLHNKIDNDSHWIELLNLFIKHPSFREDIFDTKGYAIIHIAAKLKDPEFLQVILGRQNIDKMLQTADRAQNTALHIACREYQVDNVRLLFVNPDVANTFGQCPLHLALHTGELRDHNANAVHIVDILLRRGANPNFRDKRGMSPLHYCENEEDCKNLLAHGAEPLLVNVNGHNAIQHANSRGHIGVMNLMIMWVDKTRMRTIDFASGDSDENVFDQEDARAVSF